MVLANWVQLGVLTMKDIEVIKDDVADIKEKARWINGNLLYANENQNHFAYHTIIKLVQTFLLLLILWRIW
jgi:hypothetical protein